MRRIRFGDRPDLSNVYTCDDRVARELIMGNSERTPGAEARTFLFACVHNAGRSQMAAALFNQLADPLKARAVSAGTEPAERVHPEVVEVMRESGIDLSGVQPQKLTVELARGVSVLVTMGCGDACPVVPGTRIEDWPLPDPKGQPRSEVQRIRDEIRRRVADFVDRERVRRPSS